MIHTANFYIRIDSGSDYIKRLETLYSLDYKKILEDFNVAFTSTSAKLIKKQSELMLFVCIDFIKLLDRPDITEVDYLEIKNKADNILSNIGISFEELILIRLDYRLDASIECPEERKLLFHMYKKTAEKYRFQKKYDQYDTSVYFNSKSIQSIIYDKEEEKSDKSQPIEEFDSNVLRFEVRLNNKHLNYMKHKHKVEKNFKNYFKKDLFQKYLKDKLGCFLYKGDYYNPYHYKKIIENSSLSEKDKQLLVDFLVSVSRRGIQSVKSELSRYMFKKYLKQLEELSINPISIPKNYKIELKSRGGCIKNPFSDFGA